MESQTHHDQSRLKTGPTPDDGLDRRVHHGPCAFHDKRVWPTPISGRPPRLPSCASEAAEDADWSAVVDTLTPACAKADQATSRNALPGSTPQVSGASADRMRSPPPLPACAEIQLRLRFEPFERVLKKTRRWREQVASFCSVTTPGRPDSSRTGCPQVDPDTAHEGLQQLLVEVGAAQHSHILRRASAAGMPLW